MQRQRGELVPIGEVIGGAGLHAGAAETRLGLPGARQ